MFSKLTSVTFIPRVLCATRTRGKKMIPMIYRLASVSLLLALSAPLVSAACDFCHKKAGSCRDCNGTGREGAWVLDGWDRGTGPCYTCKANGSIRVVDCASKECKFDRSIKMPNPTGPWIDRQLTKLRDAQTAGKKGRERHYKNKIEESYSLDWLLLQDTIGSGKRPARCCNSLRKTAEKKGKDTSFWGNLFGWEKVISRSSQGTCMNVGTSVCFACLCCCAVCDKYEHMLLPVLKMPTQCSLCDGMCCDAGCIQRVGEKDVCNNCLKSEEKAEENPPSTPLGATSGNSPRREPRPPTTTPPNLTLAISSSGLPDGWTEHMDSESGKRYYYNMKTGKSEWQPPFIPCYQWGRGNKL